MIRNVWTVLCRDIITDQESNSVSYLRCIEEGAAAQLPIQIGPVFLGTLWEKMVNGPASVSFRMALISPAQKHQAILQTRPIVLDQPRHRLHFRLNALRLEEFGNHMLLLDFRQAGKWETAASLPLLIREVEKETTREPVVA
jgi:hypothetical protein